MCVSYTSFLSLIYTCIFFNSLLSRATKKGRTVLVRICQVISPSVGYDNLHAQEFLFVKILRFRLLSLQFLPDFVFQRVNERFKSFAFMLNYILRNENLITTSYMHLVIIIQGSILQAFVKFPDII